jgi:YggT family protein
MLLLDVIDQVQRFVTVFATVYALTLVIYVLLSWLRLPPSLGSVQRFLNDVCEPYLRVWRRLLPFSAGPIDFSPMVAIIAVYVAGALLNLLLGQFH